MNDTTTTAPEAAVDSDILKIAAEADAASDAQTSAPTQPEQTPAPATAPAEQQTQQPAQDATPPATPTEQKPAEQKPADQKPEEKGTPYEKSKKDAERLDRSWKSLEQEKAEFRATKAQMEAQLAALQRELAQAKAAPTHATPATDKNGLTADDYDGLAKRYADEGRDDMAAVAKDRAAALRAQATTAAQQPRAVDADWTTPEFQSKWQAEVQACLKEDAALADPQNPVTKAANLLVNNQEYGPMLRSSPKGIRYAVEVARLMQAANAAQTEKTAHEATKAELATAKAEVDRLNKLLQPQRSHPTSAAPSAKAPEDMNTDDIRALAMAADRGE